MKCSKKLCVRLAYCYFLPLFLSFSPLLVAEENSALNRATVKKTVTIGYQNIYNPWKYLVSSEKIAEATGYQVKWKKFVSSAAVIKEMILGDLSIGESDVVSISAGASKGLPLEFVWVTSLVGATEALFARHDSGINSLKDLVGKKVGVPYGSSMHFLLLSALKKSGVDRRQVEIFNIPLDEMKRQWENNETIQALFSREPLLSEMERVGKVVVDSKTLLKQISRRRIFNGLVVNKNWAKQNKEFLARLIVLLYEVESFYRLSPDMWSRSSQEVNGIVELTGATPRLVVNILGKYQYLTINQQISSLWLTDSGKRGVANDLMQLSKFLFATGFLKEVKPDYSSFVNPLYAREAMRLNLSIRSRSAGELTF